MLLLPAQECLASLLRTVEIPLNRLHLLRLFLIEWPTHPLHDHQPHNQHFIHLNRLSLLLQNINQPSDNPKILQALLSEALYCLYHTPAKAGFSFRIFPQLLIDHSKIGNRANGRLRVRPKDLIALCDQPIEHTSSHCPSSTQISLRV